MIIKHKKFFSKFVLPSLILRLLRSVSEVIFSPLGLEKLMLAFTTGRTKKSRISDCAQLLFAVVCDNLKKIGNNQQIFVFVCDHLLHQMILNRSKI